MNPIILADIVVDISDPAEIAEIDDQYCLYWYQKSLADTYTDTEVLNHAYDVYIPCHFFLVFVFLFFLLSCVCVNSVIILNVVVSAYVPVSY